MKQVMLQAALKTLMWAVAVLVGLWLGVLLTQRSQRRHVVEMVDTLNTLAFQVALMAPVTPAETNEARTWVRSGK